MTLQEIINAASAYQNEILYFFFMIPLLALIAAWIQKKNSPNTGVKVFNSILVYIVSVPGILSLLLTAYSVFILRGNILELNILLYFVPLLSMISTYVIIQKSIWLKEVPWFGKISSLLLLIFLSLVIVLIFQKMFIWIIFIWNIQYLIWLFVIIFVAMKIAFDKLTK